MDNLKLEDGQIHSGPKQEIYDKVYAQIRTLISGEKDVVANMGNISSVLHHALDFHWTGFFFVRGHELVLGPFQGPTSCTRIRYGKGVCGKAWSRNETINVPDVEEFVGHIACSPDTKSEIVCPIYKSSKIVAILDVDSTELNNFDQVDQDNLEKIARMIGKKM